MKIVVAVALVIGCQQGSGAVPAQQADVVAPAPVRTIATPPFDVAAPADPVIAIGRGTQHACVVRGSGAVDCWGQPRDCQRCTVPAPPDERVRRYPEITDAVAVSPGGRCFVRRTGLVECIDRETGKLAPVEGVTHVRAVTDEGCYLLEGGGVSCLDDVIHPIKDVHDAVLLATAGRDVCIVRKDRSLACRSRFGPLEKVVKVEQVRALAMNDTMICVLAAQPRCFALDVDHVGPLEPSSTGIPTLGSAFTKATQIAIESTGEVDGLVDGKIVRSTTDVAVIVDAKLLAPGCVVRASGAVACWGDNRGGALAQPTTIGRMTTPATPVPGITNIASVGVGITETWALTRDHRVLHWGDIGDDNVIRTPVEVSFASADFSGEKIVQLVVTPSGLPCARGELGHVWCQFAVRTIRHIERLEVDRVTNLTPHSWDQVALEGADGSHTMTTNLGGPTVLAVENFTPGKSIIDGATDLVTTSDKSCAIDHGKVMCWGTQLVPRMIDGVDAVTNLAAGWDFVCAVAAAGRVACWHWFEDKPTPVAEVIASGAATLGIGGGTRTAWLASHTTLDGPRPSGNYGCAVMLDHTVQCWGANISGELLDNSFVSTPTPIGIRFDE